MLLIQTKIQNEELAADMTEFERETSTLGLAHKPYPSAPLQFAGPESVITIHVDPETLRLVFEYIAGLLVVHKAKDLLLEGLKAAATKIGESAGSIFVESLGKLWRRLIGNVQRIDTAGGRARVYLSLDFDWDGTSFSAQNAMFPQLLRTLTAEEWDRAYRVLMFRVIPTVSAFKNCGGSYGVSFDKVSVTFFYPHSFPWHWRIDLHPVGSFLVESHGILIDLEEREVEHRDIAEIVRRYAESTRR